MSVGSTPPTTDGAPLVAPEHLTKTALAIQALRGAILRGDVAADAPLTVGRIARMLGMSPTPVREAIRTLQAEGLLRHEPHHTVSVARFSAKDIRDLFQMRADLESQATALAAPRLTAADLAKLADLNRQMRITAPREDFDLLNRLNAEWHLLIYGAADNRILLDVIQHLWKRFVWEVNWILPGRATTSLEEHDAVLAALRRGEGESAAALVRAHIQSGADYAVEFIPGRPAGSAAGDTDGQK